MFEKLVAIEPVSLIPSAEEELHRYAIEVVLYRAVHASGDEMVRRIGDADAVLLSYTSRMGKEVIAQCPNIRYIGMCCSLYSEESANVDIAYARTRGIQVRGIRVYGDRGVVEYVLHELTGLLHGFGMPMLRDEPVEITGLKVGIVGLGVSGRMIADALQFMVAEISYFARSAKPDAEAAGMTFKPLAQLLAESEGDEKTGGQSVARALTAPVKQIAANAGLDGSVILEKVRTSGKNGFGFDAYKEEYCDMIASGIVDPAKVTRSALENAASVSGMVLTTESLVADKPQPAAPAAPAPDMGGMGGMY